MLIEFSGDPVRAEGTQLRATQPDHVPNPGVFAAILQALGRADQAPGQAPADAEIALPDGPVDSDDGNHPVPADDALAESADPPTSESPEKESPGQPGMTQPPAELPGKPDQTFDRSLGEPGTLQIHRTKASTEPPPASAPVAQPPVEFEVKQRDAPSEGRAQALLQSRVLEGGRAMRQGSPDNSAIRQEGIAGTPDMAGSRGTEGTALSTAHDSPILARSIPATPLPTDAPTDAPTGGPAISDATHSLKANATGLSSPASEWVSAKPTGVLSAIPATEGPAAAPFASSSFDARVAWNGSTPMAIAGGEPITSPTVPMRGGESTALDGSDTRARPSPASIEHPFAGPVRNATRTGVFESPLAPHRAEGQTTVPTDSRQSATIAAPPEENGASAHWTGSSTMSKASPDAARMQQERSSMLQTTPAWAAPGEDGGAWTSQGASMPGLHSSPIPSEYSVLPPRPPAELSRDVARQIGAQVVNLGNGRFEMSLSPAELGRVEMWLQDTDNRLILTINTERPETLDLIRRNIGLLEQEMRQLGFGGLSLQLGTNDSPGSHSARPTERAADPALSPLTAPEQTPGPQRPATMSEHLDIRL